GEGWANYIQLDFDFGRVESNPTLVQLIGLEETVVLVDLKLKFSNCEGGISIVLPGTMLTNIFTKINEDNPTRRTTAEDHSDEIMGQLRDSSLEVVAELGRTTLRLRDIYSLNVGDVIDLSQKKDSAVFLRIGGRKWFDGMMGVSEKHLAVKIKQVYQNAERRDIQGNE
ncbi:flagellar motor switch protein FliM, partial [Butyricicoccus sp. 1XD8-22]